VLDRCEETLQQTPRVMRCWLWSWVTAVAGYTSQVPILLQPFSVLCISGLAGLQRPKSELRLTIRPQTIGEAGAKWSASRRALMLKVLMAWRCHLCFVYQRLFSTPRDVLANIPTDGLLEGKAIIHFLGLLSIHPCELAYRTKYDYTPYLAAPSVVSYALVNALTASYYRVSMLK
jgi:hypothetical protein